MGTEIMRIRDIPSNQKLHIEVSAKGGALEYDVVTKFCAYGGVFVSPIRYEGKMLNFSRPDIRIKVLYLRNEQKPIEWQSCFIKSVEYKGQKYHMIGSAGVGIEVNRRGCVRIFIGDPGEAQIGAHTGIMQVTVKDISSTGFSFLGERMSDTEIGEAVHITFQESVHSEKFSLYGRLVRKVEQHETRVLYGCKMIAPHTQLDTYIALRQREQAQHLQNQLAKKSAHTLEELEKIK